MKSSGALLRLFDRIPKFVLFGAAAVIQVALIVAMVAERVQILRTGTEVTLQTHPLDLRDFLRGDYVILGYDISTVTAGELKDQPATRKGTTVFVKLAPNGDGFYEAVSAHVAPIAVNPPEVLIRGHVTYGTNCGLYSRAFCDRLQMRYNLESYFVPEGEARKLEQARNQRKLTIVAAVTPAGRAAIKRLLVDGALVYEEPWF
jgi:uncharacterized membrane-anchored protein